MTTMEKDVWVTGHTPMFHGGGYGGFMARQGLALAMFGAERIGIKEI